MTAVAEPPPPAQTVQEQTTAALNRGEGVELLGPVHGSGYKDGAALVRRGDGQMVHLGPLMYSLLEEADGQRGAAELAASISERLGRKLDQEHVDRLAEKLADQGLLAGSEHKAPPRRNPLLALRWKVLVTNPEITRRLTAPFTVLFRPWLMWPALAGFVVVCWFVLFHKGVASATAQAFNSPGLLLLVFVLAVASAGFHELGHASACRYGGAAPAGMGVGIYLVWPAFYTDVTDAYRLPKRSRLRVDLGGLYFNAVVADLTLLAWLIWRVDALLLLVALQLLQMVKQLSPVIRADGYHILSDATGVPDLFSHMGPTMRRLLPGHRHEPSALTGRARVLVTSWVLVIVPVLLSLALSAVLLLPKLATNAWDSGSHITSAIPHQLGDGDILGFLASLLRLFALFMPVIGSALVTQKFGRMTVTKARSWSEGNARRRTAAIAAGAAVIAALAWAWWPSGQYQPVRPTDRGTLVSLGQLVASPTAAVRPAQAQPPATVQLTPGRHLAVSMIPVGGATKEHPAMFFISQGKGKPAVGIVSGSAPDPSHASVGTFSPKPGDTTAASTAPPSSSATTTTATPPPASTSTSPAPVSATAFPFQLPSAPGPGGTQALATNTKDGGVLYDVAYSIVTVQDGADVTNTNSAFAIAHCNACTTVAVSFQIVLVVGQSRIIAPINAAGALNYECTSCLTTAIADQIVVTLNSLPTKELTAQLAADLKQLNALPQLGANATPGAVASAVAGVQQQIETQLHNSGLLTNSSSTSPSSSDNTTTSSSSSSGTSTTTTSSSSTTSSPTSPGATTTTTPASSTPSSTTTTTPTTPTSTTPSSTDTTTTTTPSTDSAPSADTTTTPAPAG